MLMVDTWKFGRLLIQICVLVLKIVPILQGGSGLIQFSESFVLMDFSNMAIRHCISDLLVLEQYVLFQTTAQKSDQDSEVSSL